MDKIRGTDGEVISEGKWCDHVAARGIWVNGNRPSICVVAPKIHIVIEEGIVKILCPTCFLKAIQLVVPFS